MKTLNELLTLVDQYPTRRVAVVSAHEISVIEAVGEAIKRKIAEPVLVGCESEIRNLADSAGVDLKDVQVMNEPDPFQAALQAVKMVSSGKADILMKGFIHTDDLLRSILNKEFGLRTGSIMSHVFITEIRHQERLIFITDCAMNIMPTLEQKAAILLNAVYLANIFGVENPRVAVLAAVELVNPAMPATVEAACLAKMADRNQYVPSCTVEGPLAMDNAISEAAARTKKITSSVAGHADILLVPNIESGNILVKALTYLGNYMSIGLLVGAKAPVVLTSRSDSKEAKMLSMAGAALMVNITRKLRLKVGRVHY